MATVPISEAASGDVLAKPVVNASGMLLAPAGLVLTDALIARLQSAGIDEVELRADEAALAALRDEQLRQLDARFAGHEDDPLMMELKAMVIRQMTGAAA